MKGVLTVSKEQVLEVEHYCDEHGVTRCQRITELGLNRRAYYYTHSLLSEEELHGGRFLSVLSGSGGLAPAAGAERRSRKQSSVHPEPMTIEIRTSKGAELRFIGSFNPEMLRTILGNV